MASKATEETPCKVHWQICQDLVHDVVTGQAVEAFLVYPIFSEFFWGVFPYFLIK